MKKVKWGAEAGGFVEVYPTDFIRARAEVRQGIRSHDGVVADLAVDAFTDVAPDLQLSGGPRATFATSGYYDAYYGVNAKQAAASPHAVRRMGARTADRGRGLERDETGRSDFAWLWYPLHGLARQACEPSAESASSHEMLCGGERSKNSDGAIIRVHRYSTERRQSTSRTARFQARSRLSGPPGDEWPHSCMTLIRRMQ